MAETAFATGHASTVTIWSALLFREAAKQTYFKKFSGSGADSMIQVKNDLTKEAGDTIKFDLLMDLTGDGITGDTELEGNEESLTYYQDQVVIDLRGNAVRAAGKMSMRRTKHSIREDAKTALARWMSQTRDDDMVLALSGQVNMAGQTTAEPPAASRNWIGGQTSGGVLDKETKHSDLNSATLNLFGPQVISAVKRAAKLAEPKIRPLMVDGGEHYVMLIHPYQAKALRGDSVWINAQQYANVRGRNNPLFSGALGMYDGVIIHEYEKIITRLGENGTAATEYFDVGTSDYILPNTIAAARALFCGAQAAVIGYGSMPGWYEKDFDYNRVPGIATDIVYGICKTMFNSKDFGVFSVDTAYVDDS